MTELSCNDPQQLRMQLSDPATTNMLAQIYLQLCIVGYDKNIDDIAGDVANPDKVQPIGNGRWICSWGPAKNGNDANLAFVASLISENLDKPLLHVLVIRGTDRLPYFIKGRDWGDLEQLIEDLAVKKQVAVPWLGDDHPARIAEGSALGLDVISTLRDDRGLTLYEYFLASQTGAPADGPAIVITGHSLGGCLTSLVAPWLKHILTVAGSSPYVIPYSFAGPSAGNPAFVQYLTQQFDFFPRYHNTLDIIPHWWADLPAIDEIYWPDIPTPDPIRKLNNAVAKKLPQYQQPNITDRPLSGTIFGDCEWVEEVGLQHAATNYLSLLKGE